MVRSLNELFLVVAVPLCLAATLVGQVAPPLTQRDFVLGGLEENMDSAVVRHRLGKPDSILVDESPFDVGAKLVTWRYRRVTVDFFASDRVVGLSTTDPSIPTPRGLRVGDSIARMKQLYGEPTGSYADASDYEDPHQHLHLIRVTVHDGHVAAIYLGYLLD